MPTQTGAIENGHYARKQLYGGAWVITWSHRRRFQLALDLAVGFRARRLLDYGCGDGTFLAMACDGGSAPAESVGAEISESLADDCRTRLGGRAGLSFVTIADLVGSKSAGRFDAIFCMEVLEHVVDRAPVFDLWERLLAPGGEIVVSVPNETGLALAVKQPLRRLARWCGMGDYPGLAPYTFGEFARGLFAGCRQHIDRTVHRHADGSTFHCHKGFNWRALQRELLQRWELVRFYRSPAPMLPASFNSQVWFHLRSPAGRQPGRLASSSG
jgi:SAM-dependent methyltransferase